jgi:hypothetical protein
MSAFLVVPADPGRERDDAAAERRLLGGGAESFEVLARREVLLEPGPDLGVEVLGHVRHRTVYFFR